MDAFTLDQLVVFVAVIDHGGFAAAARHLERAQSGITYAIRALEERTGLLLFDRSAYRPALTDAGRALLPRARRLIADLDDFQRYAEAFSSGLEASLTVAADPFAPLSPLMQALWELHETYPSVRVRTVVESHPLASELLSGGQAQLAVLIRVAAIGTDFEKVHLTDHELVAVASPRHPLTTVPRPIPSDELRRHMQLVYTPVSAAPDSPDFGVHALDKWYLTDVQARLQFLRAGIGWGSAPDHMVVEDIQAGRLVKLELQSWEGSDRMPRFTSYLVTRKGGVLGPAARFLVEALRRASGSSTSPA